MINQKAAAIRFGAVMHAALKKFVYEHEIPYQFFAEVWAKYRSSNTIYATGETWEHFSFLGRKFLSEFMLQYPEYELTPILAENGFKLSCNNEITRPDLIAEDKDGRYVVMDYKVSKSPVWFSDIKNQMIRGAILIRQEFGIEDNIRTIICNMVKSTGEILWDETLITTEDVNNYLSNEDLEEVLLG